MQRASGHRGPAHLPQGLCTCCPPTFPPPPSPPQGHPEPNTRGVSLSRPHACSSEDTLLHRVGRGLCLQAGARLLTAPVLPQPQRHLQTKPSPQTPVSEWPCGEQRMEPGRRVPAGGRAQPQFTDGETEAQREVWAPQCPHGSSHHMGAGTVIPCSRHSSWGSARGHLAPHTRGWWACRGQGDGGLEGSGGMEDLGGQGDGGLEGGGGTAEGSQV